MLGIVVVLLVFFMNRQSGGGGSNNRMMNFGKMCIRDRDILKTVRNLARLHKILCYIPQKESLRYTQMPLEEEMRKHSRQLRKVYGFARKRRKKNEFEELFLNSFPEFFEQAAEAERCAQEAQGKEYLEASIEKGQLCHGEYLSLIHI